MSSLRSVDPTTGLLFATHETLAPAALEAALAAAHDAARRWSTSLFAERSSALRGLARLLRERSAELAYLAAAEMGKPLREGAAEVEKCALACEFYAEHGEAFLASEPVATDASRSWVCHEPLGVVLAVMPWNYPFWQVVRCAAPTLMAGNGMLLKHAPNVQGCAAKIAELFADAGFPSGLFGNLAVEEGTVADLVADDRIAAVTLTGSVRAGSAVGALAGRAIKPSVLELGGSDAFIVADDADLDAALAGAVLGRTLNGGQSCIGAKRFVVVGRHYEAFVTRLAADFADLVVGDPRDEATNVGPLARPDLRAALHDQVERSVAAGARLMCGGVIPDREGYFYPPTVLADVRPGMAAFDEETFGPVAAVILAEDIDDAIRLANTTEFGLGASIWTRDVERAVEWIPRLAVGHVAINGIVKSDPRLPFGGIKRSGYGRELSRAGILAFVNTKTVWVR